MSAIRLFISHSAADELLARATINLVERALKLSARTVRCSSVDGYRLEGGADIADTVRTEALTADAFVALLTPASLTSGYVLFELGARWGAELHLLPLLACGASHSTLSGPLVTMNVLELTKRSQVFQAVEQLSRQLAVPMEPVGSFDAAVDDVIHAASRPLGNAGQPAPAWASSQNSASGMVATSPTDRLLDVALAKMKRLLRRSSPQSVLMLAHSVGITEQQAHELLLYDVDVVFTKSGGMQMASMVED